MSRYKNKDTENESPLDLFSENNQEIAAGILSLVFLILSIVTLGGIFDMGGKAGNIIFNGLYTAIGVLSYVVPVLLLTSAYYIWRGLDFKKLKITKIIGFTLLPISVIGLFSVYDMNFNNTISGDNIVNQGLAGILGKIVFTNIEKYIGALPTAITLASTMYASLMLIFGRKNILNLNLSADENAETDSNEKSAFMRAVAFVSNIFKSIFNSITNIINSMLNVFSFDRIDLSSRKRKTVNGKETLNGDSVDENNEKDFDTDDIYQINSDNIRDDIFADKKITKISDQDYKNENNNNIVYSKENEEKEISIKSADSDAELYSARNLRKQAAEMDLDFVMPPLNILNQDTGKSSGGDTKSKGKIIQNTLAEFGIPVDISGVTVGPTVTQFRVKTPQGFKVKNIMNYHDNIQMNLAAESIHIDAPIPGQSVVGIDVPNKEKQIIGLGTLLSSEEFKKASNLTFAVGKDVVGKPVFADIDSMPHLLIAGSTKSGKSVTIQNIIISLLYKNSPADLKLIVIDPKKVEFTVYKNLPHLYTPVITDAKNAIKCLAWAVGEMERRYDYFAENYEGIQNINDYNKKIYEPAIEKAAKSKKGLENTENLPEKFPFVVIIFDEFNDFMINYGKEMTSLITSLTQKARAAGMHLILATQRPDVRVVTGTIKANIPARIALRTSQRIDSQTIIDQGGAEDLLGNGDMLFLNPGKRPERIQAPYVSTDEVKNVVRYIKDKYYGYDIPTIDYSTNKNNTLNEINIKDSNDNSSRNFAESDADDEDEKLYNDCKEYVIMTGRASATNLQSKFGLGYAKANRMIMMLEERGIVSPLEGNKRRVLINNNDTAPQSEEN
jgi:DNA segregation ATPase FtsK/SpoIIIE, S-DNA-T family